MLFKMRFGALVGKKEDISGNASALEAGTMFEEGGSNYVLKSKFTASTDGT